MSLLDRRFVWVIAVLSREREARTIDDGMMYDGGADRHCSIDL
jgi:hypothetical protein